VVAFLTSRGLGTDAEDLAQQVFVELLERGILNRVDRERGRFRNLLFGVARNVAMRHLAKRGKAWRGGPGVQTLGEAPVPAPTPEERSLFEKEWTLNLLDLALARLAREHPHYHRAIQGFFLAGHSQQVIAEAEGKRPADVRNYVFRGKRKLMAYLREEAWATCSGADEYEDEIVRLRDALRGNPPK
jgi:RNA polymerase sigma factor (sigma-70 family)